MEVKKEEEGVEIDGQNESIEEIPEVFKEEVRTKYLAIEKFCDNEEHFDGVIQELTLFEIVLMQINQIYVDTLYNSETSTLTNASKEAIETLRNTFALEFVDQSLAKKTLADLPDLDMAIRWVQELHGNIASQLYTEDFVKEVIAPSYKKIAEAIFEVSEGQTENVEEIDVTLPSDEEYEENEGTE